MIFAGSFFVKVSGSVAKTLRYMWYSFHLFPLPSTIQFLCLHEFLIQAEGFILDTCTVMYSHSIGSSLEKELS